jgi:hypothetical protein
MRLFGREIDEILKFIVIFVAILLASSGLCGLQLLLYDHVPPGISGLFIPAGFVELGLMVLSAGAIVVFLVIWAMRSIHEKFAGRYEEEGLRLFRDEDKDGPDDRREE